MIQNADGYPLLQEGRTAIMGILNATPDSFSDGGLFISVSKAVDHVARMIDEGADIIDIGGESTRPGASPVSAEEEMERVIPIIEAVSQRFGVIISIDTSKATVMQAAVNAGAGMINDVRALKEEDALQSAVKMAVPVCLMHMQGQPQSMQDKPVYADVTTDVREFLSARVDQCLEAGMDLNNIILDPGFGFGKTTEQNFQLLNELERIRSNDLPVLAGLSRKSMIGQTLNLGVNERVSASIALALLAVWNGANILRLHDVKETCQAVRMIEAVVIREKREITEVMKFFGTDGISGRMGEEPITPSTVMKLGWALGNVLGNNGDSRGKIIIGKDTRVSGYLLESAMEAGLISAGVDVSLLGPMPTPGIAYLARTARAQAGVVISASHNPYYDNGIKFFSPAGEKLPDNTEQGDRRDDAATGQNCRLA